jgi:predicted RNase H-like HicB family nuclease
MTDQAHDEYPRYSMIFEWDPDDQIYVVTVPELPGCQTHGATLVEAVKRGRDALESWVDVARERGRPLPLPRYFVLDPIDAGVQEPVGVA